MRNLLLLICLLSATGASAQSGRTLPGKSNALDFRHSVAFTPFSGIVAYGEINPGIGFDYEYIISPEHGIGLYFPFAFGFPGPEGGFGDEQHTTAYAAPGVRFHTARRGSNVDFATGPGLLIGNMHVRPNDNYYYGPYPGIARAPYDYGMLGLVVNNSLNFYRKHFQFGFDVRTGAMLEQERDTRFFIHFGMHFGGIF